MLLPSIDDSGSIICEHEWEEEIMHETGGEFLLMHVRRFATTKVRNPDVFLLVCGYTAHLVRNGR